MSIIKTKNQIQVEQQILFNLAKIIEAFPQYTIAQHFSHFLRKKKEGKDVYFWSDETILKKVEEYYDELKTDLIHETDEEYA